MLARTTESKETMPKRAGTATVIALLTIAFTTFLVWLNADQGPLKRPKPPRAVNTRPSIFIPSRRQGFNAAPTNTMSGVPLAISRESRLIASLAQQAGPFTVSIRNLRTYNDERSLMRPVLRDNAPIGPFFLYIQVLGDEKALAGCRLDSHQIVAVDDTGKLIRSNPNPDFTLQPVTFPGGMVVVSAMESPAAGAHSLDRVEGKLTLPVAGRVADELPFCIRNVPLPNSQRLFGRAVPILITDREAGTLNHGLVVKTGPDADSLVRTSSALRLSAKFQPQQLLVGAGLPVKLGIPDPRAPDHVGLKADPDDLGFVNMDVNFKGNHWSGKLWDADTLFVALPDKSGEGRRAVAIRLSRNALAPDNSSNTPAAFPSPDGAPDGALKSSVLIDGRDFGPGSTTVSLRLLEGETWSEPRTSFVRIGHDGSFVIRNLAPGRYRLQRSAIDLAPNQIFGLPVLAAGQYLKCRFGKDITLGSWQGEGVIDVIVRPGQTTEAPPLKWMSRTRSASGPR